MNVFTALFSGMMVWSYPVSPADATVPDFGVTPLAQTDLSLYLSTMHEAADAIAKSGRVADADLTIAAQDGFAKRYQAVRSEIEALVGPRAAPPEANNVTAAADRQLLAPHAEEITALQMQVRGGAD